MTGLVPLPTAVELARRIEKREISAMEILDGVLARCERFNPGINAIVALDAAAARAAGKDSHARAQRGELKSPLDGIPVTVKDNLYLAGFRATWGSRLFERFEPPCDDISIARLRDAGAILFAKTNTPEFAIVSYTDNLLFGPTRNPWNTGLTPGGSSGGAVAALAVGMAPLAVGTDAGGSIRRPASYAGVVGLRPSTGRIPRAFGFPALAQDYQAIAPAARTVDDVYLLFRAMAGPDPRDRASLAFADYPFPRDLASVRLPRLRIRCVLGIGDAPVETEVRDNVRAAARTLASLGHTVEEGPPPYDLAQIDASWGTLSAAGVARVVAPHADWQAQVTPASRAVAERGFAVSTVDYIQAYDSTLEFRRRLPAYFENVDIVLTPTSACLPWEIGKSHPERIDGGEAGPRGGSIFSTFVNAGGLPAISVPVEPSSRGIPIGMQLVGGFGADLTVLGLARELENAAPWAARFPPLAENKS